MKAAVWKGGKNIVIEDMDDPKPKDDEVLIAVKAVGICGSELHAYEGITKRRVPPLVMGHEFAGQIVGMGSKVTKFQPGKRVVVLPLLSCGECDPCRRGKDNACVNRKLLGLDSPGAFAQYITVRSENCYEIPDAATYEEMSLIEPVSVGAHAVGISPTKLGDTILVIGAGVIGLSTLLAAKARTGGKIIVADVVGYRLDLAQRLGADIVINSESADLVKRVMEVTDGKGVDIVFESVGFERTVQQSIGSVKRAGHVTIVGLLDQMMNLDILRTVVNEVSFVGSYGYTADDFRRSVALVGSRKIDVRPLISQVLPLEDIKEGFEDLAQKRENAIKVVLKP